VRHLAQDLQRINVVNQELGHGGEHRFDLRIAAAPREV
jgi:hypothetical protein